jgi:hypothetical protein
MVLPSSTPRGAVADGAGAIFAGVACPNCLADQWPLPKHSGTPCRACGMKFDIDRTADGISTLVVFGQGIAEGDWAEYQAARSACLLRNPRPLHRINIRRLRRYAELGLWVRIECLGQGCESCRKQAQGVYASEYPPVLPNPCCANGICVCEYRPMMPTSKTRRFGR